MILQSLLRLFRAGAGTGSARLPRVVGGALAVGALVAVMSMTLLAPANAHDVVEAVEPADGSTVASVPTAVKLTFNNTPIALGAEVVVRDQNGTNQANGPVVIVDNHVSQAVRAGAPAGLYTVVWRVVSSDSHPIEGSFTFTAGKPGAPSGTVQPSPPSQASTSGSVPVWVFIAGAAVLAAAVLLTGRYVRRNLRDRTGDAS